MKTKTFVKLLRMIIREEVGKAIKTALNESSINQVTDINLKEIAEDPMPNRPIAKKQYVKDSMLNDILNETAAMPAGQEMTDWSSMNFKSEMAQSFGNQRQQNNIAPVATQGINGEPINMQNEKVASVMNAMTKDYSGLIKAIDKKNGKMGISK